MYGLLGLFGSRGTTDDRCENLHREGERIGVDSALDLMVRMRHTHTMELEETLFEYQKKMRDMRRDAHDLTVERDVYRTLAEELTRFYYAAMDHAKTMDDNGASVAALEKLYAEAAPDTERYQARVQKYLAKCVKAEEEQRPNPFGQKRGGVQQSL